MVGGSPSLRGALATKQSTFYRKMDCFALLAMTQSTNDNVLNQQKKRPMKKIIVMIHG
jgi:hypothetical protein